MRSNRVLLVIVSVIVGLLAACGGDDGSTIAGDVETLSDDETASDDETTFDQGEPVTVDLDVLTASTWTLRFGGGPDGEIPLVDGWPITITFTEDTVGGTAACNGYGGSYTIDGSQLTLGDIGMNAMGCQPDVAASEAAFVTALLDVDGINLSGGEPAELALSGPATELIFAPTEPAPLDALTGQLWLLEALVSDGEEIAVAGDPATLVLDADGSFSGSTGCRGLSGRYVVSGNGILFNEMAADGECPTSLFDQDGQVVGVLGDGFVPTVDEDTLTVTSSGNEGLRYRAITEDELGALDTTAAPSDAELLDGIEWVFTGGDSPAGPIADPATVDASAAITLTFTGDGYEGTVICNRYGGAADIGDSLWTFTLGTPDAEEEGCGDGLDEIAAAYLDALPQMTEGGIEADREALVMNGNEIELLFERAG